MLKSVARLGGLSFLIGVYMAWMLFLRLLIGDSSSRRKFQNRSLRRFSRFVLKFLHIHVDADSELFDSRKPLLIVANHLSFLDILVIASVKDATFVTSKETEQTPLLGLITKLAGCVFVERRIRGSCRTDIRKVSEVLNAGHSVVVFPEATSSNGDSLLPFRGALLTAAISAEVDVLPLFLHYRKIDDRLTDAKNRDQLFYYGDMQFARQIMRLSSTGSAEISIIPKQRIKPNRWMSGRDLADEARRVLMQDHRRFPILPASADAKPDEAWPLVPAHSLSV